MSKQSKKKAIANHARQMKYLENGVVMLPTVSEERKAGRGRKVGQD